MSQESARIYSASEVAGRLGISASLLRRYGLAWERVQGESLPQLPGLGRLYPEDVLETLEEAHAWMELRPEAGVEEALRAVLGVSAAGGRDAELAHAVQESVNRALAPLLAELHGVRAELRSLQARLGASQEPAELENAVAVAQPVDELETAWTGYERTGHEVTGREVAGREVTGREVAGRERSGRERTRGEEAETEVLEAEVVRAEPALPRRTPTERPADPDWDFGLREPPAPSSRSKIRVETPRSYEGEAWPTPWRAQPRPASADEASDFEALEDDFASERERDDEQDKGFVNWFKRNF